MSIASAPESVRYRGNPDTRPAFVAGVNCALALLKNYLTFEVPVQTGITEASTGHAFKSYQAMVSNPKYGRTGPLGDSFFVEPFFSARPVFAQLEQVRQHLLTVEELLPDGC